MQDNKTTKTPVALNDAPLARKDNPLKAHASTYEDFILWFAIPRHEKIKMGIETQEQYAKHQGMGERTINRWKKRQDFYPKLKELRDVWAKDRTQDVIAAIYRTAMSAGVGAPASQKLWMQVVEGFSEKNELQVTNRVEVGPNDIRAMIDLLPEPYRTKFYGYIDEIVNISTAVKNARGSEDARWEQANTEEHLLGEADHDAPELPGIGADVVAKGNPRSLRADMGNDTHGTASAPAHHHESAARWREK